MESPAYEKDALGIEKIHVDLEKLKKRINQFIFTVEGENAGETRHKTIKTLTTKTKRLLMQHKQVQEELQRYETEYRKALLKKAKILKKTLKQDKKKLEELKEKCRSDGVQVEDAMLNRFHKERNGPIVKLTEGKKYPTIKDKIKIRMRMKPKPAGRNIFKQKNPRRSDNIKIHIQKNMETGQRQLVFFKTSKAKERFSNLVQQKEVKSDKFRECRILLQKLTDEQAKKYTDKKKPEPRKSPGFSPGNAERRSSGVKPDWHIRIPRIILEESESEQQKINPNTPDTEPTTKRTRSADKQ